MAKPVYLPELTARMGSVLRRRDERRSGPIRIGDLAIDPSRREVTVDGVEVTLANKEYELLLMLASDPHRVFTKSELLRDIWGYRTLGRTRTLDSHASRLRRKLDPDGRALHRELLGRRLPAATGMSDELVPSLGALFPMAISMALVVAGGRVSARAGGAAHSTSASTSFAAHSRLLRSPRSRRDRTAPIRSSLRWPRFATWTGR